jgi:hypothetical protein
MSDLGAYQLIDRNADDIQREWANSNDPSFGLSGKTFQLLTSMQDKPLALYHRDGRLIHEFETR